VVTLAAWAWLVRASGSPHDASMAFHPAHHHQPFDLWALVAMVAMWQAMMVAMMTPSVLPWVLTFATLTGRECDPRSTFGRVAAFGAGYFTVWFGYSVIAATAQTALQHAGFLEMGGRLPAAAGGAVLIAAGLLYFLPLNRACLTHCRNPLTYFLTHWENGPRRGFNFGLDHGVYCVGCCWLLMVTGFAMGTMNVLWMVFLTLLICVEKLAPRGERIGAVAAVGMITWGLVLLR
jgi:predicted metal-binding membrane protein